MSDKQRENCKYTLYICVCCCAAHDSLKHTLMNHDHLQTKK